MDRGTGTNGYRRELYFNQLWQGLNFLSKALFLAVLTPLMVRTWGRDGYGLFALASSLLVSMAVLDCGVRSLTRLRLCEALARGDAEEFDQALCRGIAAFCGVALLAFLAAAGMAAAGLWSRWLQLPREGDFLIAMTVGLTGLFMASVLFLEPLAARGRISAVKAANTVGALAAIPAVGLLVWRGGSVTAAVAVYFLCLTLPNLVVFVREELGTDRFWRGWRAVSLASLLATLRSGGWFYATTLALIGKTHALTFVVSAVLGPAAAGTFYILLRITELVGNVGATASDTSLASLAGEPELKVRAENFRLSYSYMLVFTLYGALVIGFLTPMALAKWVPQQAAAAPPGIGWAMAGFGLAGAFSKMVVNASMGTGWVRRGALGNLAEAAGVIVFGWLLQRWLGLDGLFLGAVFAVLAMVPTARKVAGSLGRSFSEMWLRPAAPLLPLLGGTALLLGAAAASGYLLAGLPSILATSGAVIFEIRRLHRGEVRPGVG